MQLTTPTASTFPLKLNGKKVTIDEIVALKHAWPKQRCLSCPRPAYGCYKVVSGNKLQLVTWCAACALGNRLQPRRGDSVDFLFQIEMPEQVAASVLVSEAVVNAELGIGLPHIDPPGVFVAFAVASAVKPEDRHRTLLGILHGMTAHEAISECVARYHHRPGAVLSVLRAPEPTQEAV